MAADQVGVVQKTGLGPFKYLKWDNGWWGAAGAWVADGSPETYTGLVVQDGSLNSTASENQVRDNAGDLGTLLLHDHARRVSISAVISAAGTALPADFEIKSGTLMELSADDITYVKYRCEDATIEREVNPVEPWRLTATLVREASMESAYDA